jgi:hyperosmotically inducible protein
MNTSSHSAVLRRTVASLCVATVLSVGLITAATATNMPTAHSDSAGAAISDTAITAKVKSKFMDDSQVKGSHIKVVTTNGVVTLTGSATTAESKSAAVELAKSVSGVKSVDDELTTGSGTSSTHKAVSKTETEGSDSWITTKVKSEITADSMSKGFDVHVKTMNGVVMLKGTLPNKDAIAHVKDLAEKVKGVKSVDTTALMSTAR